MAQAECDGAGRSFGTGSVPGTRGAGHHAAASTRWSPRGAARPGSAGCPTAIHTRERQQPIGTLPSITTTTLRGSDPARRRAWAAIGEKHIRNRSAPRGRSRHAGRWQQVQARVQGQAGLSVTDLRAARRASILRDHASAGADGHQHSCRVASAAAQAWLVAGSRETVGMVLARFIGTGSPTHSIQARPLIWLSASAAARVDAKGMRGSTRPPMAGMTARQDR